MLPKIAALLSPIGASAVTKLSSHMCALMQIAAPIGGHAIAFLLHIALAPANATLSLLAATGRLAFATIAAALHLAPIYLLHWM